VNSLSPFGLSVLVLDVDEPIVNSDATAGIPLRQGGGSLSGTVEGTRDVEQLIDTETAPYLAPEAITVADADGQLLNVFSLGAIAYLVFTGQPPATSLAALTERLQRDGGLEVSAILDGAGEYLSALVRDATAADATDRTATVADFIDGIALVEEQLTAPEQADGSEDRWRPSRETASPASRW
jgi:hypothetical protein